MSMPLLQTKLFIPSAHADCIPRPHLLAKLNSGLSGKLTLVSAPAGFGKTTLIVDWIAHLRDRTKLPVPSAPRICWLSLDDDDNQQNRFFAYLIAALQTVDAQWGETVVSLLQSPQPVPPTQIITLLINDLAQAGGPSPIVLVLDDYHVIHNQEIHQALTFLLNNAPAGFHLALTTRSDPPLPLPQMRVRRQMTEIREAELRFTTAETASFLNQMQAIALPSEQINALTNRTEGWIAALQLAALALQGQDRGQQADFVASFGGGYAHVVDYLLDEVWQRQPEAVQSFWLATAVLEQLSGPLCDALTGREDGQQMLADLHRSNLFLTPLDNEHRWYRYHRLFADMLRARAAALGAAELRGLHKQAAHWYATHQNLPQAIHHALAADDLAEASRLIGLAAEAALRQGDVATIQQWLTALPDEHVRSHHQLALAKGWVAYLNGQIDTAVTYMTAAQQAWPENSDPGPKISLLSLQTFLAVLRGDHQTGIALAQEALALAENEQHNLRGLLLLNLMQTQTALGAIDDAVATGYQAMRAGFEQNNAFLAASLQDSLLQLLLLQGKFQEAIRLGEAAVSHYVDRRNEPLPIAGQLYVSWGKAHFERGEIERAYSLTQQGLRLSEALAAAMAVSSGRLHLAQIEALRGETEAALALLANLQALREPPHFQLVAAALLADVQLRQGNTAAALAWAENAALPRSEVPVPGFEMVYLAYVRCLLVDGRWSEADTLLAKMVAATQAQARRGSLVPILVVQALSQQAQEKTSVAKETLREAVQLAMLEGHKRPFLEDLHQLVPLLKAIRSAAEPFVTGLLSQVDSLAPVVAQTSLLEPLNEREIQILRLINAGQTNPEIARELYLSVNTVKWYVKEIFQKLNVSNRKEAAAYARERGLL